MEEFLVAYDYGTGGLWAIVLAESADAIKALYPEVVVQPPRPDWMDDTRNERLRREALSLNDPAPDGMLKAIVASRSK